MQQTSPHAPIISKDNSTIKHLRSLSEHKNRKKEKAFLLEGVKMVEEALRDNRGVKIVVASPSLVQHHGRGVLKLAESKQIEIFWISEKLMDSLSESKSPQPVMAEVRMRQHTAEELLSHNAKLVVIAHQLQDPGNLGTIIRTSEAIGASGVAITAKTVDPYNSKTVRASMGSILRLPVVPIVDIAVFISICKQNGFQTIATALTGDTTPYDIDLKKPSALILGQEGGGLPEEIMQHVDFHVRIPMAAAIDSLNVSTAAAVILYEALRQRSGRQ